MSVTHMQPSDQFLARAGSVGYLVPNLEARIIGETGVDVNPGEPGELWLRGPTVMKVGISGEDTHWGEPDYAHD